MSTDQTSTLSSTTTEKKGTTFICSFNGCTASFSREDRLAHHHRIHSGERPFACEYVGCEKNYTRKEHLKRHLATAHLSQTVAESLIKCHQCDKIVKTNQSLQKHIRRIHQERIFKCETCGISFKKHQQLRVHEYEHTGVKPFCCPVDCCKKSFRLPSQLKRHQKTHEGYACDTDSCEETFTTWSAFRKHKLLKHKPENKCQICNRVFNNKNRLQEHSASHAEMREAFHCSYEGCARYYFFKKNLRQHIRSYHLKKHYVCPHEDCQKTVVNRAKLKQHLRSHDPKPITSCRTSKKRKERTKLSTASIITGFKPPKEGKATLNSETLLESSFDLIKHDDGSSSSDSTVSDAVEQKMIFSDGNNQELASNVMSPKTDMLSVNCACSAIIDKNSVSNLYDSHPVKIH